MFSEEELKGLRREHYWRTRDQIDAQILSNSESYDRSLLSLSSGLLGGSVAFINLLFPLREAQYLWMFYCAISGFILTIGLVVYTFIPSQKTLNSARDAAFKYYIEDDKEAGPLINSEIRKVLKLSTFSGYVFLFSISLLCLFILINTMWSQYMNDSSDQSGRRAQIPSAFTVFPSKSPEPSTPILTESSPPPSPQPSSPPTDTPATPSRAAEDDKN